MRLVFCGTPAFAVPTLEALLAAGHDVALVVSQPDRPVGRAQHLTAPPVKQAALTAGLAVTQPEKIKSNAEFRASLGSIAPDAIVVVAYGRIIPPWMLALPRLGCINLHGSLLPKYRGAAPIQWAVAMGDAVTGNTTMLLEEGLDTGPILLQQTVEIGPHQTAADLFELLAQAGAPLVVKTLAGLDARTIHPQPQNHEGATYAPLLDREDGRMDFANRTAHELYNRWRGFQPWPGAFTTLDGKKLILHQVAVATHACRPRRAWRDSRRRPAPLRGMCGVYLDRAARTATGRQEAAPGGRVSAREPVLGRRAPRGADRMTLPPPLAAKKTAPKNRQAAISKARKAAFDVLLAVERGHAHSDDLLRGKAINALSTPDRNLATALVLGVLRWQILLDHRLQSLLKRPNAKLEAEIVAALRLGAFQILHMDRIPARAAIDESVELAKQAGHRFASGMVNAVLRKLAGAAPPGQFSEGSAAELALAEAHPAWLVERWASFYGLEAARAICRYGQAQAALTIRLTSGDTEAELRLDGIELAPGHLLGAARTVVSGDAAATVAFREGRFRIQDEGSQLVAEIAAACLAEDANSILDACAAPGGKTLILAERNPNARILACEASAVRFEQLRQRMSAYAPRIECRLADATALNEEAAFDLVLVDVPCSGTGTLGRNPEIRHRLRLEDLARQAERQRAILASALRAVRRGGRVVYSTCSLEPEENEEVVAAVLNSMPAARAVPLTDTLIALLQKGFLSAPAAERLRAGLTPEGACRLFPGKFQTDGFFIARIERRE